MHVRKVENDWVKRLPWQNGTDGALLREVFDIYEKWGMSNLIPAFAAVKHVFGQDSQKAITVEAALEKVQELRRASEAAEASQQEKKQTTAGESRDITREMIFAKIKEQQLAKLQHAQSAVTSLEAELALSLETDEENKEYRTTLQNARHARDDLSKKISDGQAAFREADMDEAMNALVGIRKQTEDYMEKMLQLHKSSKPPPRPSLVSPPQAVLSAVDIQKHLKAIWCQLVRALILQNGSGTKSVGTVELGTTESTPRGKLALTAIVHEEISNTMSIHANQGESLCAYTLRLQASNRFIKWTISMLLQAAEETQGLQLADIQFFKVLKSALPENWAFMGEVALSGGFPMLCSKIMEFCSDSTPSPTTPTKKVAFVALGGKLSRQPGARVVGETRTEQHNKTVVTEYLPRGEPKQTQADEEDSEEESQESVITRIKNIESALAEAQKTTARTSREKDSTEEKREDPTTAAAFVSLLREIRGQGRSPDKTNKECYGFARRGQCVFGDKCKFIHDFKGGDGPPAYPSPIKERRAENEHDSKPCYAHVKGTCTWGSSCKFDHASEHTMRSPVKSPAKRHENPRCAFSVKQGYCSDKHCFEQHGKFDERATRLCHLVKEGKPCTFMWLPSGCYNNHKEALTRKEESVRK